MDYKIDPKQVRDLDRNLGKMKALVDIREVDPETLEVENHRLKVIASSTGGTTKAYVDEGDKKNRDYTDSKIKTLSAVAKTGDYNDLDNKPNLKPVATSGKFRDLEDIPALGSTKVVDNLNSLPDSGEDGTTYLVEDGVLAKLFIDVFYPVGTYYETSDIDFNPNDAWGGTWVEDTAGRMLVARDDSKFKTVGSVGGEIEHKLTIPELPKHKHYSTYGNFPTVDENGNGGPLHGYKVNLGAALTSKTNLSSEVGSDIAHNNMPPYIVIKRWHRTA